MKKDIKLKGTEVICYNCHGNTPAFGESLAVCMVCWGTGKLDWIDLCVGKKRPSVIDSMPILRKTYPKLIAKELISIQPVKLDDNK